MAINVSNDLADCSISPGDHPKKLGALSPVDIDADPDREPSTKMLGLRAPIAMQPNLPARKVTQPIHQDARDLARNIATTDAYLTSSCQREKVGMPFAHLKRILKMDRLRLRGPNGAKEEFHLAAAAQTLSKIAEICR